MPAHSHQADGQEGVSERELLIGVLGSATESLDAAWIGAETVAHAPVTHPLVSRSQAGARRMHWRNSNLLILPVGVCGNPDTTSKYRGT